MLKVGLKIFKMKLLKILKIVKIGKLKPNNGLKYPKAGKMYQNQGFFYWFLTLISTRKLFWVEILHPFFTAEKNPVVSETDVVPL